MSNKRGFTLIELLVVVAIIGLLASIVIASLNTARQKGRDARRVSDIKMLQLALGIYNDANSGYPSSTQPTVSGASNPLVASGYIASIPNDPSTALQYAYVPLGTTASGSGLCSSYHMGAVLEVAGSASLSSAAKAAAATICSGITNARWGDSATNQSADFNGLSSGCNTTGTTGCFDTKN